MAAALMLPLDACTAALPAAVPAEYRPVGLTVPTPPLATDQAKTGCAVIALPFWS